MNLTMRKSSNTHIMRLPSLANLPPSEAVASHAERVGRSRPSGKGRSSR